MSHKIIRFMHQIFNVKNHLVFMCDSSQCFAKIVFIISNQIIIRNTTILPINLNITNHFINSYTTITYLFMDANLDLLNLKEEKSITKNLDPGETILMSCLIFKFNDYKAKQQRNLMVTNKNVYNLKGTDIKRKIPLDKIRAITIGRLGTQFVLHIPEEYDYRYASPDKREKIILMILRGWSTLNKTKMPIYFKDQLSLVNHAMTKEEKKKNSSKDLGKDQQLHDQESYRKLIEGEQAAQQQVRKTTKTLFAKDSKQTVSLADFVPRIVLGKGAFGTVLLVEKKNSKQLFAMKSINKQDIIKKHQLEHTKTQKMVLEHINHPYLVNLAYAFQTTSKLYFIMQFMKGGQLFQHLSNAKKFPEKRAKFYVMQIALALGHLHKSDVLYRDLKLQNVLMDEEGNVCLTDFGMAKIVKEGQLATTFCGTPQYVAPQVIAGGGYHKEADWWSLGILAYEMMYGLPPFYSKTQNDMFKLIQEGELKFNDKVDVSKEGKDFISKMLIRNPGNRLGSKNDVDDVLSHQWFSDLNRQKMLNKQLTTPFKPKVGGDDWISGFDKQFTSQKPIYDQKQPTKGADKYSQMFKDF